MERYPHRKRTSDFQNLQHAVEPSYQQLSWPQVCGITVGFLPSRPQLDEGDELI